MDDAQSEPKSVRVAPLGLEGLLGVPHGAQGLVIFAHGRNEVRTRRFCPNCRRYGMLRRSAGIEPMDDPRSEPKSVRIPPLGLEPSPFFALLKTLARRHDVMGLSMGMSADYKDAVMLGATAVRVGTALFEA